MGGAHSREQLFDELREGSSGQPARRSTDWLASSHPPLAVLLITNNVSGIFDDIRVRLPLWISQIGATIDSHQPDFVAIHVQEVGGSNWRRNGLSQIGAVSRMLGEKFPKFWCSGLLCDTDLSDAFTALGAVFFVRKSIADRVHMWRFREREGGDGILSPVSSLPSPLTEEPGADPLLCRLSQFPTDMFFDGKLSRKGYLITRWRLDKVVIDLVNIHNMHDELNTVGVQRDATSDESQYARRRRECLEFTMNQQLELSASLDPKPACFVFGDFNFRQNTADVINDLCGPAELERARSLNEKDPSITLQSASRTGAAIEFGPKRFRLINPERAMERKFDEFNKEVAPSPLLMSPLPRALPSCNLWDSSLRPTHPLLHHPHWKYRDPCSRCSQVKFLHSSPLGARVFETRETQAEAIRDASCVPSEL